MRNALSLIFLIASITSSFAQSFEGKITYRGSYTSKIPNMTTQQFTSMMGDKQEYYIKGGDYKSVTNGTLAQWQLYINKDNKLYTKVSSSQIIYWNDATVNDDSVISVTLNKGVTTILGYKCDELILTCKSGIQKYYFNSSLGIDAKLFANHQYGNWYNYLSQAHAVPLKMTIDNPQFTLESVATDVTPMKLDSREFELPANAQTQKSPY